MYRAGSLQEYILSFAESYPYTEELSVEDFYYYRDKDKIDPGHCDFINTVPLQDLYWVLHYPTMSYFHIPCISLSLVLSDGNRVVWGEAFHVQGKIIIYLPCEITPDFKVKNVYADFGFSTPTGYSFFSEIVNTDVQSCISFVRSNSRYKIDHRRRRRVFKKVLKAKTQTLLPEQIALMKIHKAKF